VTVQSDFLMSGYIFVFDYTETPNIVKNFKSQKSKEK